MLFRLLVELETKRADVAFDGVFGEIFTDGRDEFHTSVTIVVDGVGSHDGGCRLLFFFWHCFCSFRCCEHCSTYSVYRARSKRGQSILTASTLPKASLRLEEQSIF